MRIIPLSALLLASTAMPAIAVTEEQPVGSTAGMDVADEEQSEENASDEIVVIAERIRGSVDTDVPPVEQLNEADIAAVGASSLTDLVAAVSPQTNSGRGRGGGQPVILLNGQ
eukprot:gene32196-54633_t